MPLDGPFSIEPSLSMLSHFLRDKDLWPKGFIWDYSNCNTCAMGLAVEMFNLTLGTSDNDANLLFPFPAQTYLHAMLETFGLKENEARKIFTRLGDPERGINFHWGDIGAVIRNQRKITPEKVADAIDAYLAKQPLKVAA